HYQLQTGKFLFPDDLTAANRRMRHVIGEPYITELDRFVASAVTEAGVMQAVKALASPDKQQHFAAQANIWNHGPVTQSTQEDLAELGF
ncbi:MAG: hypothetical protein R3348_07620, partial [Xanthomonadales bacterium]|nr:hypothetical protein [Xanthomonadales bacterium]